MSRLLPWVISIGLCGCAEVPARAPAPSTTGATAELPPLLVTTAASRLMASGPTPVALAHPRARLPISVRTAPGGALVATIHGGIEVTGELENNELGVLVCTPGDVGERYYVGAGNLLTLRSTIDAGRVKVRGTAVVDDRAVGPTTFAGAPVSRAHLDVSWTFDGDLEVSRLCTTPPPPRHAGTNADPFVGHAAGEVDDEDFPHGTPTVDVAPHVRVSLRDAPNGAEFSQLDGGEFGLVVMKLASRDGWDRIAFGGGPYVTGWIASKTPGLTTRTDSELLAMLGELAVDKRPGPISLRAKVLLQYPLHELPQGTEIRQFGQTRARLTKPGFARVGAQRGDWRYVFVAVDDDVMVEGWIDPARVGAKLEDAGK